MPVDGQGVNPQGAAPAQAAQGAAAPAAAGAAGDGGASQTIPYARFKEVNDQLAAFKQLGFAPDELTEALGVLATLLQQQESAQQASGAQAQPTAQQTNGNGQWNPAEFEKWLVQQIPWLTQVKSFYENSQKEKQLSTEALVNRSRAELKKLAMKAGYTEDQLEDLENAVSGMMHGNPDMLNRWRFGDFSVVQEAFEGHQERFVKPAATRYAQQLSGVKAKNRSELAPRVEGGAAAAPNQPLKPKSVKEARDTALQRLADAGSDIPEEPDTGLAE